MKLVIDNAIFKYQDFFGAFGNITAVAGAEINPEVLNDADVLIVRSRTKVDETLLANSPVKFVGSAVAGIDHIDGDYLAKRNIAFHAAHGSNANAVAEYVIAALSNLATDMKFNLADKTLAIIGFGNVGNALKKKADALKITSYINDPPRQLIDKKTSFCDLNTALTADIISLHTPLTMHGEFASHHLLNAQNLPLLKNKILINTARGGVIDEVAWLATQTQANIIDCWQNEPDINTRLQHSAYLATPHIAGHSIDAKMCGSLSVYQALCCFLKTTPHINTINTESFIEVPTKTFDNESLSTVINDIYNFRRDAEAIKDLSDFEHYRRHYPDRYEWHHYQSPVLKGLT